MSSEHPSRRLDSLRIRDVRHLCFLLGTNEKELKSICSSLNRCPNRLYKRGIIVKKGKERPTSTPLGRFRTIIDRLNRLLQRLRYPDNMHGGLKGRTTRTYARPHVSKRAILKSDLENCFPNIRPGMVYDAFVGGLSCSPDVARYLTRLVTLEGQLPQGSPTSTVVANIVSEPLARRLEGLAFSFRGESGTFVDDIVISGPAYVGKLERIVKKIICQEGFRPNEKKTKIVYRYQEQVLAGIRVNNGLGAPTEKIRDVRGRIDRLHTDLRTGKASDYKSLESIRGKIRYIGLYNRGAANSLWKRLGKARSASPAVP